MAPLQKKTHKTMINRRFQTRSAFPLLLLVLAVTISSTEKLPLSTAEGSCDKQRKVFTNVYGFISSGDKEYPMDSHCEWLIRANSSDMFITLHFIKMDTECSYDHIFVYDGDSYSSPLLGSFSGNTTPSAVTARNGAMLILLYSDTNYVRNGFEASYIITDCPSNCSEKGLCIDHQCLCDPLRTGEACEISLCPNDCGIAEHKGECINNLRKTKCKCGLGYSGVDCSLPVSNKNGGNSWHVLSPDGMGVSKRAGHVGVYVENLDTFYIFGGYTFGKILGDLVAFSFSTNEWMNVTQSNGPSARRGHAAVTYGNIFYIFGGELEDGTLSNDLWQFNTSSLEWHLLSDGQFRPPPLTKHSLTLVENRWLYVFGGSLANGAFSSDMYRADIDGNVTWENVTTLGGKQSIRRIVGHTTIYYQPSKTLFIFGGVTVEYSHVSKLSNQIHAFHVEKKYWTRISYHKDRNTPLERAFHSAAVIGDYMLIYGGYTHRHLEEEICYDNETHLYHLICHKWIDATNLVKDYAGSQSPVGQGVFSHAMAVRHGHTLLIHGGYSGVMRSSFLAYVLPSAIIGGHPLVNPCASHKSIESCTSNLACGWCSVQNVCMEKKKRKICSDMIMNPCPGLCHSLSNCHSCLIWGDTAGANMISDDQLQDPFPTACAWCVQATVCLPLHDAPIFCSVHSDSSSAALGPNAVRWWGSNETAVTMISGCYTEDFQPGLISIKYRYPVNWTQPDDVSFVKLASDDLYFRSELQKNDSAETEENVVKFIGFLHPLGAKPLSERMNQLQLHMCSAGSSAVLKLSNDTKHSHLETVANHTTRSSFYCSEVHRPSGGPIFPNTTRGHKYLLDFTVNLPTTINETSAMQLAWNAFSVQAEVIGYQYLEPYKNGSCSQYQNCLACLTDTACGWCEVEAQCQYKNSKSQVICKKDGESHFLITEPSDCAVCSDYVYCKHCTQIPFCEWLVETAYCVRRGRFEHAVKQPDLCPMPCQLRTNCSSCLGDPGVCAWCEATQTCFLFSTYTTSYMYGQCRDWVDENRSEPNVDPVFLCRDCSRHKSCKTCLRDLTCGWCSYANDPVLGTCVQGDFSKPSEKGCLAHLNEKLDAVKPAGIAHWSYDTCPDIEECLLGMHECHDNATCKNTPESYVCECNVGFKGDGKLCIRACAVKCVNGFCSEAPDYKCVCELGWTGEDCNNNCGCHNHSSCYKGVGLCDECQDWTEGQFCETCRSGSYGNAVTSNGCQKCECNNHGNTALGYCNATTGDCYCEDNTEGPNCTKCQSGYFGDPRNGGQCFLECLPRGVITQASKGRLGSPARSSVSADCLWLLTVYPVLDMPSLLGPMPSTEASIELVIHEDINVPCPHNHVYVYDGLPDFIASGHPNVLLGAFCSSNLSRPISVIATSGYLTIHYKRNEFGHGFNSTYTRLEQCFNANKTTCFAESCETVSDDIHCMEEICPNNCSASQNHGVCDMMYGKCICENSHGGDDCSVKLKPHNLAWTSLYNYGKAAEKLFDMPSGRIGHSLLAVNNESDDVENLWLFGGISSASGDMNDLFMFETLRRQWFKIEGENAPPPRHFHAAAAYEDSIYIFGGLSRKDVLGDFWEFNTASGVWSQLTTPSNIFPMAGSSLTPVKEGRLFLVGGFSPKHGFFDKVVEFDTKRKHWYSINSTGAQPIGLYGHSSVYHSDTESIYIFGGVTYEVDNVANSSKLYSFHYPSKQWYRLPPDTQVNPFKTRPLPRYFHDAVVTKYYMIILGGQSSDYSKEFPRPYAYIFACNLWISLGDEDIQVVGKSPDSLVGGSSAVANGDMYVYGGFDGELKKLSAPVDFCQLFSLNRVGCIHHTGCAFCSVYENGVNQTFCYSQNWHIPSSCYNPKGASEVVPAVSCNSDWIEKRDCSQYSTCTDCVASWPVFREAKQVCQWCSNCKVGRCIPAGTSCENENDCNIPRKVINQSSMCPLRVCWASDCEKCQSLKMCIWTRQVRRSSGFGHMLNRKPIYNWICVMKEIQDAPPFPISSMPPLKCPAPCTQLTNCSSCLQSSGGEGGWHECLWSETLQSCMSPSFEFLRCEDGSCGPVLRGNASLCPIPCWHHQQASHCLSHANCGWCSFTGTEVDGRGLCMEGGIMGPSGGLCRDGQVLLNGFPLPAITQKWWSLSTGAPHWTYLKQPPENECANGHHDCDEMHEECVDTLEGYKCTCKSGYELKGAVCKPVCQQGCVNGTCIRPDVCLCSFGYVGQNCSIACKCNGHSNCPGPDALENCLKCQNNTQGSQCHKCKPFFVGNPMNGGKCTPCHSYCHRHSSICFNSELLTNNATTFTQPFNQTLISEFLEKVIEGAWDDAVCMDCQNNTEGKRCDQCVPGYFKAGENFEDGCRLCVCHGHGDTCNPFNGESCNCQNNTENDRQCSQKNTKNIITPCWQLQCTKCKEYFLGAPAHGHQCYRHMFLDKDYCFDPNTQEECNRKPNPLLQGRTVFFAVQPRYMNVDIRIVVDVTEGGIDFLLSAKEDTFIVDVNKTSGIHYISLDKKYGMDLKNDFEFLYHGKPTADKKNKRETIMEDTFRESSNFTESFVSFPLRLREGDAEGLTTYITVKKSHEFLLIRNLENRLIITIPQEVHDLRSTRFYMVLRGAGTQLTSLTYGSLFFRQDQTRIDLFVFFSVFFSCFFLFLAICVVVWKVKQAFDVRRARRLHAAEMKHMASRPFGHVVTIVDEERDDFDLVLYSPSNYRKKVKHSKVYGRDSPKVMEDKFSLRPLAVEPLADSTGAVASILVQLPGGAQSLVKMTLASALITSRSSHYHVGCGIRAAMRRRTSHANV